MYQTFGELKEEVATQLSQTVTSIETREMDSIERRINQIQDWITFHKNWTWRQRTFYITLRTPYETGTITATKGSKAVTGASTVWTDSMKLGYLVINNKAYKIQSIDTSTTLTLEAAFD